MIAAVHLKPQRRESVTLTAFPVWTELPPPPPKGWSHSRRTAQQRRRSAGSASPPSAPTSAGDWRKPCWRPGGPGTRTRRPTVNQGRCYRKGSRVRAPGGQGAAPPRPGQTANQRAPCSSPGDHREPRVKTAALAPPGGQSGRSRAAHRSVINEDERESQSCCGGRS